MFKLIVILLLFGVVGSLFSGLFFLYRDRGGRPHRTGADAAYRLCRS
jgi:hypothetical protein